MTFQLAKLDQRKQLRQLSSNQPVVIEERQHEGEVHPSYGATNNLMKLVFLTEARIKRAHLTAHMGIEYWRHGGPRQARFLSDWQVSSSFGDMAREKAAASIVRGGGFCAAGTTGELA